MKITVHLKSGSSFEQTNVDVVEGPTYFRIVEESGAYTILPLASLDWADVEADDD